MSVLKITFLLAIAGHLLCGVCDCLMTYVGGLVGTGLYYYGEETAFKVSNCTVKAEIIGAVTPGAVAGRAVNSIIESCDAQVTLDGESLINEIGETTTMYESGDQFEEETPADNAA